MKRLGLCLLVAALLMALLAAGPSFAQEPHPHWTYEGEEGPDHWGDLSPDYALCSTGHSQSPIDIGQVAVDDVPAIEFNYGPSVLNILNNGHTIQVNYIPGSSITFDGVEYQLIQFHFHHPSEHSIGGQSFDMELHLVHRDADENLAVVGVLLEAGDTDNPAYVPIWENAPSETMEEAETVEGVMINAIDLLPEDFHVFTYSGSLTTPPCSEGVRWLVLTEPVTLSSSQIETFGMNLFEINNRPVQPDP